MREELIIRGCFPVLTQIFNQTRNIWQEDMANVKTVYPMNILQVENPKPGFILEYALAGFTKDNIDINIEENVLYINAEKSNEIPEGKEYLRRGISYKQLSASYKLLDEIDQEAIKVKFENGLLSIFLPLKEEKIPKKIKVAID